MSLFSNGDLAAFKSDRLLRAAQTYWPDVTLSDDYLLRKLWAAEAEVSRLLRVFLEPTTVFPYTPSEDEITALAGAPWAEEPAYDYDGSFFRPESWGYLVTRQRPIISITWVRLAYPDPANRFFEIPADWPRVDKKYGHIRFVPATSTFAAPLNAFLMQAIGGGQTIPSMIQVKYVAGLKDVKTDPRWADLLDVIYKKAALGVIEDSYLPQSGSISADGLSQSLSVDPSKYADQVDVKLFGPKGSNGGLFASIHGAVGTIAGVLA